jgi:hypothetical protein
MIALSSAYAPIPATVAEREKLIRALGFEVDDPQASAIVQARYCLVRNDGPEKWRCARCNQKHEHYTSFCLPRPWRGLEHALLGYWTNVGATNPADLTPAQREKLSRLAPIFGLGKAPVPLAASHPRTARELGTRETDATQGATILGSLDPITPLRARMLADQINARARCVLIRL